LKFLLDANAGSTIARALRAAGHEVSRVALDMPDAPDDVVLERAVSENCILVTYDRDFGELVFQHGAAQPVAIIYIRFEPDDIYEVVERLMPLLDEAALRGHMTIIGYENTRRRPFPKRDPDNG